MYKNRMCTVEWTERGERKFEVNPGKIKSPLCSESGLSEGEKVGQDLQGSGGLKLDSGGALK